MNMVNIHHSNMSVLSSSGPSWWKAEESQNTEELIQLQKSQPLCTHIDFPLTRLLWAVQHQGTKDAVEWEGRTEYHLLRLQSLKVEYYCLFTPGFSKAWAASCYMDYDMLLIQEVAFITLCWEISKTNAVRHCEFSKLSDTLQQQRLLQKQSPVHHLSVIPNAVITGKRHLQWKSSPTRYI